MPQAENLQPDLEPAPNPRIVAPDRNELQTLEEILQLIQARRDQIAEALDPIIREVQKDLDALEGTSFSSFEENRTLVNAINALLSRLGMRIECAKKDCGAPSYVRCTDSSKTGAFQFEHKENGRKTHHQGKNELPRLKIIPAREGGNSRSESGNC